MVLEPTISHFTAIFQHRVLENAASDFSVSHLVLRISPPALHVSPLWFEMKSSNFIVISYRISAWQNETRRRMGQPSGRIKSAIKGDGGVTSASGGPVTQDQPR